MTESIRRPRRSAVRRAFAAFAVTSFLAVSFPMVPAAGAEEAHRVESTAGRVEQATGPQGLVDLAARGKVTVRALMGWGRLPRDLTDVLVAQRAKGVDLLGADAETLTARAEEARKAGDATAPALARLAELLRHHEYLDWAPLASGAKVAPGALVRTAPGASARLVDAGGRSLEIDANATLVVPPSLPGDAASALATAPAPAPVPAAREASPECLAALAALDATAAPGPDAPRTGYLGDLQIDLPAGWLPIPESDRQVVAGYFLGDIKTKNAVTLGLSVAPVPEPEMVKQVSKDLKAELRGPTAVTIGGKAANRYELTTSQGGEPYWLMFHMFQEPRADGTHLVIVAGGAGSTGREAQPVVRKVLEGARAAEPPYRLVHRVGGPGDGDGQLKYAEGIGVDSSGNLFVLDAHHHRVQVFDAEGRFLRKWGERGRELQHLSMPQDLVVGRDGSVWVLDDRRVKHYSPQGQFLGVWGDGRPAGELNELFDAEKAHLAPDGSLYLIDGKGLKRVSPEGARLAAWPAIPGRVAVDPRGFITWIDRDKGRVHRHGPDGGPLGDWSVVGVTAVALSEKTVDGFTPESITADGDGNLYVGDNDGVVRKYDPSGRFLVQVGPLLFGGEGGTGGPARLRHVTDLTVDASGQLYVSDRYQDTVFVLAPSAEQRPRCVTGPGAGQPGGAPTARTPPAPPAQPRQPAQPAAQAPQPVAVGAAVVNGAPPDDGPSKARVPLRLEALARQALDTTAGPATARHAGFAVQFPAGSLSKPAEVVISRVADPPPAPYGGLKPIAALDVSVTGQTRFRQPVTLELSYADLGIPAEAPGSSALQVAWWNEDYAQWVVLPAHVDAARRVVTVQTRHLTAFGWFMKTLGYGVITLGDFEVAYDRELFTPPKENTAEAWASKVIYSGDGNLARLFPNGLPAYLSDPKLPVFLRDLGAYLNHAHARYREVGFKLPAAPVQVLVENTLGEQDFRDKASGLIHVGASSTGHSLLRRVAAHELFHAVQNEYYWDIGGMTFADWWCDATADYASDVVVWGESRPSRSVKPKFFSADLTATADEHAYQAAHFVDFLVGHSGEPGKQLKAMWESVANADWWNLHDVLYPLSEYLRTAHGKGLNPYFHEFVAHTLFHPDSGMPANDHGSVPAEAMTAWGLLRESESETGKLTMSLKAGHRAKAWGLQVQVPDGKTRVVPLRLEGPLDGYKRASVHVLPGDRRAESALAPVATFSDQNRNVTVTVRPKDGIYLVVANADDGKGGDYTLTIGAAPLALRMPVVVFTLAGDQVALQAGLPHQRMPKRPVFLWEFSDTEQVQRTEVPRVTRRYEARDSGLARVLLYDGETGELVSVGMTTVVVAVPGPEPGARDGVRTQMQEMSRMLESQMSAALASLPGATLDEKYQAMAQRQAGQPAPTEEERLRAIEVFSAMANTPADAAAVLSGMRRLLRDPPQRLPAAHAP